jgi:acetyl esterase
MPLDPQVRTVLDQMDAAGQPPLHELSPAEARAAMTNLAALGKYPDEQAATEDRRIPGPDGEIPVRIYTPTASQPLPVVVYFHGGGWVIGGIETHDSTCQHLATAVPAVVVSVDYRMAPEYPFPAPLEDCVAATRWVYDHAEELGADPARLAVAGDSAGGNLAAVVSLKAREQGGPPIVFQLLVYPATDLTCSFASHVENGEGYLLTGEGIRWFLDLYIPDADRKNPDASPHFAEDLSGLPAALIITAEFDPLRDEGEAYAARLREAGVLAKASRYDGMIHGFFGMDLVLGSASDALQEAAAALRQALYPAGA